METETIVIKIVVEYDLNGEDREHVADTLVKRISDKLNWKVLSVGKADPKTTFVTDK